MSVARPSMRTSRSRAVSDSGKRRKIPPGTKVWKEGMLMKMGAVHKAWQPRYMVLRGGVWEYYSDINAWKDGKEPKGQLVVAEAKAARSKELEAEKKLGLTFTPAGSERTYLFMCASFDDQQKWLSILNEAIAAEPPLNMNLDKNSKLALSGRGRQLSMRPLEIVNPDIDIEGWLMRKGSGIGGVGLKSWTKRYFRLTSVSFNMFKSEKIDQKPLVAISVGNLDNVDYFATKREGNRFDVLSHDEFGSSLTSLYATDAKTALHWCRRIRKAMDEWEQTKDKLKPSELNRKPGNMQLGIENVSTNRSRGLSDTENSGKDDPEEDYMGYIGVSDNIDEVLGQLGTLEGEEEEPAEDPPEIDVSEPNDNTAIDEEQQILRDRQRAETGVETKQMMESNKEMRKSFGDSERRFLAKREELKKAIQALEEDVSDTAGEEEDEQDGSMGTAENQTFPSIRLPSLVDILKQLDMTDYREALKKHQLSSLDLLEMTNTRLSALIPPKGPRGRLQRYLGPFARLRAQADTVLQMNQLERSLERIGAELSRAGTCISRLNVVIHHSVEVA